MRIVLGSLKKNVKQLAGVQDAKVNFGASKIDVYGNASVQELEKAGAFENLKVFPEKTSEFIDASGQRRH
ncbi:heavy metal-associated domain-containing protein [Staphylococcus aureus]|uniref:heavy-metal-associated domain-containing protein n=1 Tax=Staphylococcus aureus TaxID=1280 RepID=UPI000E01751D|nr:heavy metal-associated domain-containing protein [Staphylococcus aureus]SUK17728.1 cadmium translocating P-type ATPase CadA, putative [Staphylococcus aureus]